MKNLGKQIIPNRIKQARITRGMSILQLAERLDITKQAISQYELGKNEPSMAVLNTMSSILKYPISFFYKPLSTEDSADSAVFFRSAKTASVKNYNAAKERIKIFRDINEYLEKFIEFPKISIPRIDYCDHMTSIDADKIEEYSMKLREYWGLGKHPINNLLGTLERNGIILSRMNLGLSKIDGFSIWHNKRPFIFICSDKESNARLRFSASHEIGHLYMHADFFTEDAELRDGVLYSRLEEEANAFAGAFLLPKDTFSKDVYSSSIDHFIQLKSKWKVSISAMINRCDFLGLLSQNQITYLKNQMTARIYWRSEPLDNTIPIEKPVAHKQAINLLLDNKLISAYDLVENTGVHLSELEEYCFLEKGSLTFDNASNVISMKLL